MKHPHRDTALAVLLIVALLLAASGCAALKPIGALLLEHGIAKAEELAKGGKAAIDGARAKLDAIPDAVDRITAELEIMRAEQIYQTGLLEYLASCNPPPLASCNPPPLATAPRVESPNEAASH